MAVNTSDLSERAARNEDQARKINEQIEPTNAAHAWVNPPMPDWLCECASEDCAKAVRMTVSDYEAVRADPRRFLVAPSAEHVLVGVERVIERNEDYWVVEKVGKAGDLTEALDERD